MQKARIHALSDGHARTIELARALAAGRENAECRAIFAAAATT